MHDDIRQSLCRQKRQIENEASSRLKVLCLPSFIPEAMPANDSFLSLLESPLFTFTIGAKDEESKDFVFHTAVVEALGGQLAALVNGHFREARQRHARLEDVEVDTFRRCLEFAYMRNYTDPMSRDWPTSRDHGEGNENDFLDLVQVDVFEELSRTKNKDHITRSKSGQLEPGFYTRKNFWARGYAVGAFPKSYPSLSSSPPEHDMSRDMSPVLLSHAKLCLFVEQRMLPRLKEVALYKEDKVLSRYVLDSEQGLSPTLGLIEYVFEDSPTPEVIDGEQEPLRDMIVHYVISQSSFIDTLSIIS